MYAASVPLFFDGSLVTVTFLRSKPWTLFHSDTYQEFFKQAFVTKWSFTRSFQHGLAHSIAAFSRDFWAPYTSYTGMAACGQALDWDPDWSSKSSSPQGQSQPKSPFKLQVPQTVVSLSFITGLSAFCRCHCHFFWRETVIRQIIPVQNTNLKNSSGEKQRKQTRNGVYC